MEHDLLDVRNHDFWLTSSGPQDSKSVRQVGRGLVELQNAIGVVL